MEKSRDHGVPLRLTRWPAWVSAPPAPPVPDPKPLRVDDVCVLLCMLPCSGHSGGLSRAAPIQKH